MLAQIRKYAGSALAVVLFSFLIVSFLFTGNRVSGIEDAFAMHGVDAVVVAGGRVLDTADFKNEFDRRLKNLEEEEKRQISMEEVAALGLDKQLLQASASQEATGALITRMGVKPAPALIAEKLRGIPAFFNQITGKFDPTAYRGQLQQIGLTDKKFEASLADDIAREHFFTGIQAGMVMPRTYGAFQAAYALENRTTSAFVIDASKVPPSVQPTDDQLKAFLIEVAAQVRKPEIRQLTVVRFSTKVIAPTMTADPAEVQKLYDFRKDQMNKPETRSVVQIPAKDQAAAQAIAARLAKGEDPQAVAKAVGATPIVLTNKPKTAFPDRKIGEVAFSLPAGQSSGPITGELGIGVVKVLSITPGETVPIDKVRSHLEEEVKQRAAEQKISEMADKFEAAHSGGANIVDAAKTIGLTPSTTPLVAANGATADGKPAPGVSPKLLDVAFKLPQGGESDIENEGNGEYFIVRVDKIEPPAMPTVDEIRPNLTKVYMFRDLNKRLQGKADELAARMRKGESIEAVAASVNSNVQHIAAIDRLNSQQAGHVLGQTFLQAAFAAKPNDVFVAPLPNAAALLVAKLDSVMPGDVARMAQLTLRARQSISNELFQAAGEEISQTAPHLVKVKTYPDRARLALGMEPEKKADKGKKPDTGPLDAKAKG